LKGKKGPWEERKSETMRSEQVGKNRLLNQYLEITRREGGIIFWQRKTPVEGEGGALFKVVKGDAFP